MFIRILIVLLLLAGPAQAADWRGRVLDVVDGDSLIITRVGRPVEVRLSGVDCPEYRQPWGKAATNYCENLALDQRVTVHPVSYDRYNRTVATVTLPDGRDLGQALVAAGWAWWYRRYAPDDRVLESLEERARALKLGLWSTTAEPPWKYRKGKR